MQREVGFDPGHHAKQFFSAIFNLVGTVHAVSAIEAGLTGFVQSLALGRGDVAQGRTDVQGS